MLEYEDVELGKAYKYNDDCYIFDRKDAGRYRYIMVPLHDQTMRYDYIDRDDWYYRSPDGEYAFLYTSLVSGQTSSLFLRKAIKFVLDREE